MRAMLDVLEGLAFGARKYSPEGWRTLPGADVICYEAALRHLQAYALGEDTDPESGVPHTALAALRCLMLTELRSGIQTRFVGKKTRAAQAPTKNKARHTRGAKRV